jgi:beta-glucosidase
MKKSVLAVLVVVLVLAWQLISGCSHPSPASVSGARQVAFRNPALPTEKRVADLLSRMTVEEKISQMVNAAPTIERLGIPKYEWWNECVHGVMGDKVTVFPQAIGLAATWNPDLLGRVATAISDEARAVYEPNGSEKFGRGGLTYWSPVVNIARDPRWGRTQECYGEDTYLVSRLGVAFVKGLQGDDPKYLKVIATPKHYAANNEEYRRHSGSSEVPEELLYEYYLPQFKACIVEGKAYSIMGAYNAVNGVPCCANPKLLDEILRGEWGFKGFVVSDCGAIDDIFTQHHYVPTGEEAVAVALKAGCDLNCGDTYKKYLKAALEKGLVTEKDIDLSVGRLMRARFLLGMFDPDEMVPYSRIPKSVVDSPEHRQLARQAARESIVLLKNQGNALPLDSSKLKSLAVIGPNADAVRFGNYSGSNKNATTILAGIKAKVGQDVKVEYAIGCELIPAEPIGSEYLRPEGGEANQHGLKGEYFDNKDLQGAPKFVRVDERVKFDWKGNSPDPNLPADGFSVRWSGKLISPITGPCAMTVKSDDGVRLYIDGKKVLDVWHDRAPATDVVEVPLEKGRQYAIRLEYYENAMWAQVTLGWNAVIGRDRIAEAAGVAARCDAAVVVLGLSDSLEGEERDRGSLDLPDAQVSLIKAICKANPRVVVVLLNGAPITAGWVKDNVPAMVEAWYPGEEGGNAVADVLFGDYNPSGRLPLTFYASLDQLPPFNDYDIRKGRTYMYLKDSPLFAFGHGLSYTTFEYSELKVSGKVKPGRSARVSVKVKNVGVRSGQEVVQLYVHDTQTKVVRPLKQLQGFRKVDLKAGETRTVEFTLPYESLAFYDARLKRFVVEPGKFDIMVGSSSDDIRLRGVFEAAR